MVNSVRYLDCKQLKIKYDIESYTVGDHFTSSNAQWAKSGFKQPLTIKKVLQNRTQN